MLGQLLISAELRNSAKTEGAGRERGREQMGEADETKNKCRQGDYFLSERTEPLIHNCL